MLPCLKNPHGSQLLCVSTSPKVGWAASAYRKMEGAAPHPGVHKHRFQYDGRPDGHFLEQVVAWNTGSMSGNCEVCDELRKRMCVLLTRGRNDRTGF